MQNVDEIEEATVERVPLWNDRLGDNGQKVDEVLKRFAERRTSIEQFVTA